MLIIVFRSELQLKLGFLLGQTVHHLDLFFIVDAQLRSFLKLFHLDIISSFNQVVLQIVHNEINGNSILFVRDV